MNFVTLHRKVVKILSIIDNILTLLKQQGLKQTDLCNFIGINTSTMTNWKNRKTDPPAKYIIQICEFLDVTPFKLLTGREKTSDVDLTADEQELLETYRKLTDANKTRLAERGLTLAEQQETVET